MSEVYARRRDLASRPSRPTGCRSRRRAARIYVWMPVPPGDELGRRSPNGS